MKYYPLALLALISGCSAQQQFVQTGYPRSLAAKDPSQVVIYSSASQVPFPYVEIGELNYSKEIHHVTPKRQIQDIKQEAAKNGADGVILHSNLATTSFGSAINGQAVSWGESYVLFSGTAIIRKDTVAYESPIIEPITQ